MDGLALSELMRKELPKTKIVTISGYDDFSYAQQAYNIVFFSLNGANSSGSMLESYNDALAEVQDEVTHSFANHSELLLFRWNVNAYLHPAEC